MKSDQEPSILALLAAVKRELREACEIVPEESPVGEHQSNGQVENAIKNVQGQVRTMRIGLQSRYKRRIKADHPIMPWLIHHGAFVLDICKVGQDGRTPYEARKGKRFLRPMPEIGKCIWYLRRNQLVKTSSTPDGSKESLQVSERNQESSMYSPTKELSR